MRKAIVINIGIFKALTYRLIMVSIYIWCVFSCATFLPSGLKESIGFYISEDLKGALQVNEMNVFPQSVFYNTKTTLKISFRLSYNFPIKSVLLFLSYDPDQNYIFNVSSNQTVWETNISVTATSAKTLNLILKLANFRNKTVFYTNAIPIIKQDVIYLSVNGDDSNNGLKETPVRTFQNAIQLVKQRKVGKIYASEGIYTNRNLQNVCMEIINIPGLSITGGWNPDFSVCNTVNYNTILDGNNLARNVVFISGSSNIILENLTIMRGYNPIKTGIGGGGISSTNSTWTANRCKIINNNALRYGGGIFARDSTIHLIKSVVAHNASITNSASFGGGLYIFNTGGTISSNTIAFNTTGHSMGGGIYIRYAKPLIIQDSIIVSNSAQLLDGGGVYIESSSNNVWIIRNSFQYNRTITAGAGGAIACTISSPNIHSNTFVQNNAMEKGDGIYLYNSSQPSIVANTFENNDAYSIFEGDASSDPSELRKNIFKTFSASKYRDEDTTDIVDILQLNTLFGLSGSDTNRLN